MPSRYCLLFPPQNAGGSQPRVLIPQPPQFYLTQQISTTTAGATPFIRAPAPYPQFAATQGLLSFNPQLLAQQQLGTQFTLPPGGQAINLQLNPSTAVPMGQAAGQPPTTLVGNQFPVAAQPKQQQAAKRGSKAIKIVDPSTMTEVDVTSGKPATSNEPVITATAVSSQAGPLPPPHNGAPPSSDVVQDFKQKVQSTMNVSSAEFVPSQPLTQDPPRPNAIIRHPEPLTQDPPRPNAIIRHPDEVKPDVTKEVETLPPAVNGVDSKPTEEVSKEQEEPMLPLEPPPTEPEKEKPEEVSTTCEPPPTEVSPPVELPPEPITKEIPPTEVSPSPQEAVPETEPLQAEPEVTLPVQLVKDTEATPTEAIPSEPIPTEAPPIESSPPSEEPSVPIVESEVKPESGEEEEEEKEEPQAMLVEEVPEPPGESVGVVS